MKEHDNRLEDLLHKYNFDQLSNSDKDYVLSEMSALEYNHLHKIVQVAKYEYNDTDLPPNIKTLIKKDLKNKWPRQKTWTTILTPFLWISLGALLVHFIWNPNNNHAVQKPASLPAILQVDTVYIELRDTIVKEVEAPPIVQIKEVIKYIEVEKLIGTAPIVSTSNPSRYVDSEPTKLSRKISSAKETGEPISKEKELMDLLTPILTDGLDR